MVASRETEMHPARLHVHWSEEDYRRLLTQVLECIAVDGLDVLHFHYGVPFAFVAAEVKQRLGWASPLLVGTLHGTDVSTYGRDLAIRPRLAQALRSLDCLTTVSDSHAQLTSELFGLAAPPQIIPNFIDLARFPAVPAGRLNGHGGPARPRIAHVSNFRPVKDTPGMVRIFAGIRQHMEAELWLIGEGPDLDQVKAILRQTGLEQDARFWGLQHDVGPILAQADLLLMTSRAESFCLAALEAMACGLPVLATRVGGLPEVVADGETGCLFPVDQPEVAVDLAIDLLSNPTKHRAMREAALRQAVRFSAHQIVPRYEALYQTLLDRCLLPAAEVAVAR